MKITKKNIGIQLLRFFLCFWVVLHHCLCKKNKYLFFHFFKIRLHVPCFIIISFYFSYGTISKRNNIKIRQRFQRLLIPYFIFPVIVLLLNNLAFFFFNKSIFGYKISLDDLIIQLIIGRKFIVVFWYQSFLILTTLSFTIISFLFKDKYLFILEIIYILCYMLRYSNLNFEFFTHFSSVIRYSIAQYIEVMPMSISGSIIASLNLLSLFKKYIKKVYFFSFVGLYFIYNYNIFTEIKKFAYDGIILDVGSVLLFFIFYLFPLNCFDSSIINMILYQITNYTQGIYSLHLLLKKALNLKINQIKKGNYSGCVIIYILSYFISFLGEKLTRNSQLVYLFI